MHLCLMAQAWLWRGNLEKVRLYTSSFGRCVDNRPWILEALPEPHRGRILAIGAVLAESLEPVPWNPADAAAGSLWLDGLDGYQEERSVVEHFLAGGYLARMLGGEPERVAVESEVMWGRSDLRVWTGRQMHLIEFKSAPADHKVVGQIEKYMRSAGGNIHHGLYDDVIGWVLAPGFAPDTQVALRSMGVRAVSLAWREMWRRPLSQATPEPSS